MQTSLDRTSFSLPSIRRGFQFVAALVCAGALQAPCHGQQVEVKSGEKIAFLGDSITAQGAASPVGYVRLVIAGLAANGIQAEAIGAGISGHKSDHMLARLENDVLAKKPNWMTLSCGVNDVWHGAKGIPLDQYKQNITAIIDRTQAAGVKVMVLTSTMIMEDPAAANNVKLAEYNEFLRTIAKEKKCLLADLNTDMQTLVKAAGPQPANTKLLTVDGVHMNPVGNQMMATGVLKAFGESSDQLAKARDSWLDIPHAVDATGKTSLTLREFNQLKDLAAKQKLTVSQLLDAETSKACAQLLKTSEVKK